MKRITNFALLIIFAFTSFASVIAQSTAAQNAPSTDVISVKAFKKAMKENKNLVIIDASKTKNYKKNHVKNAHHILYGDLNKAKTVAPLGTIQSPKFIAGYMSKKGISADDEIIIYDGGLQKYSSRMYFTLKYAGAKNVKIVHKDMAIWGKNRIALTAKVPKARPATTFKVNAKNNMLVDLDYVMANKDKENVVLVDTRSHKEFIGEKKIVDGKFGRMPGSINIPFEEFETKTGAFKSVKELKALATKYGLGNDKQIIFFCKTGVKGAVAYIAFNNILNHPNTKLYDGGLTDYASKHKLVK